MIYILLFLPQIFSAELKYFEMVLGTGTGLYSFSPNPTSNYITLTTSSSSRIQILLKKDKAPSQTDYLLKCTNSFALPSSTFSLNSTYYLLITSTSDYSLMLAQSNSSEILDSFALQRSISQGYQDVFTYTLPNSTQNLIISLMYFIGNVDLLVSDQELTPENSYATENWSFGKTFEIKNFTKTEFKISVVGIDNTDYTLVIDIGNEIKMTSDSVSGLVDEGKMSKYIYNFSDLSSIKIKLSIFSGECDLYLKVNNTVSLSSFDWAFTDHGAKIVTISEQQRKSIPGSKYSIGIYGKKFSAFYLSIASTSVRVTPMKSGMPYIGSVSNLEFEYYTITVSTDQVLQIHLSASTGNPDLYAKFIYDNVCSFTEAEKNEVSEDIYKSINHYNTEELSINRNGTLCIAVFGESVESSDYSIVSILDNNEILLMAGYPQSGMIADKGYRYYKYNLSKITASEIHFLLSPVSGNPDLYVSNSKVPSKDSYDSSSALSGLEVDSIKYVKGTDYSALNGTYHISVYSQEPTRFSIVVKEIHPDGNTTILLIPGIPQKDTLYNSCMNHRLYYFPIHFDENSKKNIRITVTPITGKFHIYVTNRIENIDFNRRIFWYYWEDNADSTDLLNSVTIPTSNIHYLTNSNYAVLVKATRFSSDQSATYSITLQLGQGTMILAENSPFIDVLSENGYNYYTFPITLQRKNVVIMLTAFTGIPRLYVSVNNTHPSSADYQFSSRWQGSDQLQILWSSISNNCPEIPTEYHHGDPTHCNLYISVYSKTKASYSLTIHTASTIISSLLIPSTFLSLLGAGPKYFYSIVDSDRDVLFNVQTSIGSLKVYAKLYSSIQSDIFGLELPQPNNNDFVSESYLINTEKMKILALTMKEKCKNQCLILVSVECEECEFYIAAIQDQAITLVDGETFVASVGQKEFVHFSYYCDREDQDFIIDLSPMSYGDPDLFVKKSVNEFPNKNDYDWKAQTWKSEVLTISRSDPFFQNKTIKGNYLLGVYGFDPCSFTIKVTQNPKKVTQLISGIPDHGSLSKSDFDYYYYRSVMKNNIIVKVTPISGNVIIFANSQELYADEMYEKLPDLNNYQWSSVNSNSLTSLVIPANSSSFCTSCNIIIGVYAESNSSYSITTNHDIKITLLENGIPQRGEVERQTWKIYYFEVSQESDFDVSLTSFSGDSDLFISDSAEISLESAYWKSTTSNEVDHLTISESDPKFRIGSYYIGVYSLGASSYSITAHMRKSFVSLISGWPQTYSISPSDTLYFQYSPNSYFDQTVSCNLHPLKDSLKPQVLALVSQSYQYPSLDTANFVYGIRDYEDYYISLNVKIVLKRQEKLFLAVKGDEKNVLDFQLHCSGTDDTVVLNFNHGLIEKILSPALKRVYEINVQTKGTINVYVIPCEGMQKLEISSNWTVSQMQVPDFSVTRLVDGKLMGTINNAVGKYYVTVTTLEESTHFSGSSYEIIPYFSHKNSHLVIFPGGNGKVLLSKEKNGFVVSWNKPIYQNLTEVNSKSVRYLVYSSKVILKPTVCSIMGSSLRNESKMLIETNENFYIYDNKESTYINVIAVLPYNIDAFRYITYDFVKIEYSETSEKSTVWIWVLLLLVCLAVALVLYFKCKTKAIKQRIDIEMTVGRNMPEKGNEKLALSEFKDQII